jgi:hypothetical protein
VFVIQYIYNRLYYCIKWTGLDYNSVWYNSESFKRSLYKLKKFYNQYLDKPNLSHYLLDWLQCYNNNTELEEQ